MMYGGGGGGRGSGGGARAGGAAGAVGAAAAPRNQSQAQMRVPILLIPKVKPAMSQMTMRIRRIRQQRADAVVVAGAVNLM